MHYFFGAVFPLAASIRLKERMVPGGVPQSHMRTHGKLVSEIAYRVCRVEAALMKLNKLAGLSVVMLARKSVQ